MSLKMLKMRQTRATAVLVLAGVLAVTAGCSGSNNNGAGNSNVAATSNTQGEAANADAGKQDLKPVTFSFFGADASPNWNKMQDEVGKVITEKTGVTIKAEYAESGGATDKISLMAASGQYPDMVFAKGDVDKLVDAGALIDLTDLIDKYAPNLKKVYGKYMQRLKYSKEDTSIYVLPSNDSIDQTYFDAGGGFELQQRVLKELGYPQIRTLEDYENALKTYYAKHPTTDGKPTIPLTLDTDDWRIMITGTNPAFLATGLPDDGEYYINPDTYEASFHIRRPEEKEYFRWLNKMFNEGLLDKEAFVQKSDQYKSKIASGRVLGLIDQEWGYGDAENAIKSKDEGAYTYGHFPVTISADVKDHSFAPTGFMAGYGIAITKDCKDPVRAIQFLDWMASDEGQVLRNWGIEGKQYNVENGIRVIPADIQKQKIEDNTNFTKNTGIGLYFVFGPHYGDGVKDPSGSYYTTNFPDQIVAGYTNAEKETLKAYGATTWKDLFPKETEFKERPYGAAWNIPAPSDSDYNVIFKKAEDIIWKKIPEAVLAKPADFDKVYDSMLKQLDDVNLGKIEKIYTQAVKDRVEQWSAK